jgi:hypothetical protein
MSEQSVASTEQISLSQVDRPQEALDARRRKQMASAFLDSHEKRQKVLLEAIDPWTAVTSVWKFPLQNGAESMLEWAFQTHHSILAEQRPEWDFCPRCGCQIRSVEP